jgi:DNA-binding beta-propeller fold protein YncE
MGRWGPHIRVAALCDHAVMRELLLLLPLLAGPSAKPASKPSVATNAATPTYAVSTVTLPGGGADGIGMDVMAYDAHTGFVWAPAGNTGAVDVVDTATGKITQIAGFATKEVEGRGGKRRVGPSAATVGDGVIYVGNRGDSTICAVDARTLAKGACGTLDASPDLLAYVGQTREVWVTTPRDKSIRVLDAGTLAQKAKLAFDGEPEALAVDGARGRVYSNLEDKDRTLAIDIKTHETAAIWNPACGEGGPHGISLDEEAGLLFIACDARAVVMDVGHDGKVVSSIDTGDGADDVVYSPSTHLLYVGAARGGKLTIAKADNAGHLTLYAAVPTPVGTRNAIVTKDGTAYLAHGGGVKSSDLVVVTPRGK